MELQTTPIPGLLVIKPRVFRDDRGYFFESFNQALLDAAGISPHFVQDNQSLSAAGVIRGLHFQGPPSAQGKLVRVVRGSALDVAVDIRRGSPHYGQHFKILLSADNHLILWIPAGFAHGFLSLEDNTTFTYKCTDYYNPAAEGSLRWDDPALGIDWGIQHPVISPKDQAAQGFQDFVTPFAL